MALAWSAEPEPQTPDAAPPYAEALDEASAPLEVLVFGELLVEQARAEVVEALEELGYDAEVHDRGDRVVYRHAAPWRGEVVLHDTGYVRVKRQPLRVEGVKVPWAARDTPLAWAGCLIYPWACVKVGGATIGERKWRNVEDGAVGHVQPKAAVWSDRIADLATDRVVAVLPDRLTALWESGTPLEGETPLTTFADRRAALLSFWASRTDTPWGDSVRGSVVGFCRGVVQRSEHPFTTAELAAFNATRDAAARPRLEL